MKKTDAVLGPLLKNLGLESGVRLVRIRDHWPRLFDDQITSNLFPASFSDNELLLNVSSPVWLQQFTFHKKDILEKLSVYGVQKIRFRLGKIPRKQDMPPRRKPCELTSEQREFLATILSNLSDDGLKDSIKKAAEKSFLSVRVSDSKS